MPLLNVRLTPEDARRAAALRESGLPISRLVREAIRTEYDRRLTRRKSRRRPAAVMAAIYAAHPDPKELAPRGYDVGDRRAARLAIVRILRSKRRRRR